MRERHRKKRVHITFYTVDSYRPAALAHITTLPPSPLTTTVTSTFVALAASTR